MMCSKLANQHARRPKHTATTSSSDAAADNPAVKSGMSRRKCRTISPCCGTSSARPGKAETKLATIYCRCEVDLRGGCKTTAGCKTSREPARGARGLLLRGCRDDEGAGPARWLIPGGCQAEEDAGTAAGCNEDKRADGAGGAGTEEKPSSSCNHSMESSTCTDGAGTEKPTNSRSHSAESSTCTDAAGAEKPIISRTHSSAEASASAMQAEAKPEATPKPLEPTKKWLRKRQIFLPAGSNRCRAKRRSPISGKPV